jgi:hypothetical protein
MKQVLSIIFLYTLFSEMEENNLLHLIYFTFRIGSRILVKVILTDPLRMLHFLLHVFLGKVAASRIIMWYCLVHGSYSNLILEKAYYCQLSEKNLDSVGSIADDNIILLKIEQVFIIILSTMVEQTLVALLEGRSLQLAMTMMHQLMNMVRIYYFWIHH